MVLVNQDGVDHSYHRGQSTLLLLFVPFFLLFIQIPKLKDEWQGVNFFLHSWS